MSETRERYAGMPSFDKKQLSLQIPQLHQLLRRVSLCAFQKGSFTLEASMLLPFFLCAVMTLLSMFLLMASRARDYRSLMEKAQTMAVTVGQEKKKDPYIKLYDPAMETLPYEGWFPKRLWHTQMASVRAWVGYTGESFQDGDKEAIVYMTPEGEVWHRSCECHYLSLSVRMISYAALDTERNRSGEIYAACESCVGKNWSGTAVYITDYGSSYHSGRHCRGLKRTVMAVPWSQVRGIRSCSKCG